METRTTPRGSTENGLLSINTYHKSKVVNRHSYTTRDTKLLTEGPELVQDTKIVLRLPFYLQQDCASTSKDITTLCFFYLVFLIYSPCDIFRGVQYDGKTRGVVKRMGLVDY